MNDSVYSYPTVGKQTQKETTIMGCDIHLHIEVKIDGQWHHYGHPAIERSYRLFEKMAGVRGDAAKALIPPRGIPSDATFLTTFNYELWEGDAHTPSWLGVREIMELEDWLNTDLGGLKSHNDLEYDILHTYLFGNSFSGLIKFPGDYATGLKQKLEDARFVFWFDN